MDFGRDANPVPAADRVGDVLAVAAQASVVGVIDIGTDLATSRDAIGRAESWPGVYASVGVHPHEADAAIADDASWDTLATLAAHERVVAIGECGLDYFYDHSDRPAQQQAFAEQLSIALRLGLPAVIHTRDAWDDTFEILDRVGVPPRSVLHCFTGGPDEMSACVERGLMISFSGIVTFKNAAPIRQAAALCPPDRLLVETDTPFLAPVPHRGRQNQPGFVPLVGAEVAALRGVAVEQIEALAVANTCATYPKATEWASPAASGVGPGSR